MNKQERTEVSSAAEKPGSWLVRTNRLLARNVFFLYVFLLVVTPIFIVIAGYSYFWIGIEDLSKLIRAYSAIFVVLAASELIRHVYNYWSKRRK